MQANMRKDQTFHCWIENVNTFFPKQKFSQLWMSSKTEQNIWKIHCRSHTAFAKKIANLFIGCLYIYLKNVSLISCPSCIWSSQTIFMLCFTIIWIPLISHNMKVDYLHQVSYRHCQPCLITSYFGETGSDWLFKFGR